MKAKLLEIKEEYASSEGYGCWKEDMLLGALETCTTDYIDWLFDALMLRAYEAGKKEGWNEALELEERNLLLFLEFAQELFMRKGFQPNPSLINMVKAWKDVAEEKGILNLKKE